MSKYVRSAPGELEGCHPGRRTHSSLAWENTEHKALDVTRCYPHLPG